MQSTSFWLQKTRCCFFKASGRDLRQKARNGEGYHAEIELYLEWLVFDYYYFLRQMYWNTIWRLMMIKKKKDL